jgi:hypothetical protein
VHRFLSELHDLALPAGDHALFGSGPLLVRGWIDEVGDLDVFARGAAWEKATAHGKLVPLPDGVEIAYVGEGVTVLPGWPFGPTSMDRMIDTAEMIDQVPCVRLEHIVAYMRRFDRPKDRERLRIIEANS